MEERATDEEAPRPRRGARSGYHDPTAGIGGSTVGRSALTLRALLAVFGLAVCVAGAVLFAVVGVGTGWVVALVVLAVVALVDLVVVLRRKLGGEPG